MSAEETEIITANFNQKAMENLECNNFNNALSLLHQAHYLLKNKKLTDPVIKLKCITLNNLGCIYKRLEKPKRALQYLHEALALATRFSPNIDVAGIHLNICAINSLLSAHEEALFHALKGLKIAQKDFIPQSNSIHTLLSGYFQTAYEFIYLFKSKEALKYLQYGYELACTHLGKNHMTTNRFFKALHDKSLKAVNKKIIREIRIKPILSPIEQVKITRKVNRSEVKSTEPLNIHKIRKINQSYSSSPLKNTALKSNLSNSKNTLVNNSPISHNIKYIGNALNMMQKKLDKYADKFVKIDKINSESGSNYSTPTGARFKRYNAAVKIQKNLRMWKCRKKYRKTLENIKTIQRAFRNWRYIKYLARKQNKISHFSQQFNKNILNKHIEDLRSRMMDADAQTSFSIYKEEMNLGYTPESKLGKFYNLLVFIQKHIRRFLTRKKFDKRKKSLIIIQKNLKMYLTRKKYLAYLNERKLINKKNDTALIIQKNLKMAIQRKKYKKQKESIILIQLMFRNYKAKTTPLYENVIVKSQKNWI